MLWIAVHLPALSLESWAAALGRTAAMPARAAAAAPTTGQVHRAAAPPPAPTPPPLVLLQAHRVVLADAAARARGVRPGMARATVQALLPEALLGAADPWRDVQALRVVAHAALGFSPTVCWSTPVLAGVAGRHGVAGAASAPVGGGPSTGPSTGVRAVQSAVLEGSPLQPAASPALVGVRLEVSRCLRLFGGLPALLQRLHEALAPLGHRVRVASAPTALGAALLAAWRADLALGPHTTCLATLDRLLDELPLDLLGLDQARHQALQGMGLQRLKHLHGLPREGLARRFGPALLDDIDRARGQRPDAHTVLQLPQRFAQRWELLHRADSAEPVLAAAQLLLARLAVWAQARQGRVARCTLVLHHGPRHRHDSPVPEHSPLVIAPAQPVADAAHLLLLLRERLTRQPLPAPVLELGLHCDALAALPPPNRELFGPQFASPESRHEGLARLVERLQARLGRERVLQLQPVADHRPEHGTRWLPADAAALAAARSGISAAAPPSGAAGIAAGQAAGGASAAEALRSAWAQRLPRQPMWLLPQPQALRVDARGLLLDGCPLRLLAGPDRLETGWWDGQPAQRDYYVAQAADGALLWVYCSRQPEPSAAADGGGWFLQGLFG